MFTGIIEAIGTVVSAEPSEAGRRIVVDGGDFLAGVVAGESVANSGCCLTAATDATGTGVVPFDVIPETLDKTTLGSLAAGSRVNLERSVTPTTLLSGHVVQGHVDSTGDVVSIDESDGWRIRVAVPADLRLWVIPKGSVAIDGISLTIADLADDGSWLECAIIPETLDRTTLSERVAGDRVNLECDVMVKTIVTTLERFEAMKAK